MVVGLFFGGKKLASCYEIIKGVGEEGEERKKRKKEQPVTSQAAVSEGNSA